MERLKALLQKHSVTQLRLAIAIGMTPTHVNHLLNGKHQPRRDAIDKILAFARGLEPGITYEQLFGRGGAEGRRRRSA
jgi:transcriptional regulator with XRE-family HTH domain